MASHLEIRERQRDKLYTLLKIKLDNKDMPIKGLKEEINATEAVMDEEDVAWVEKKIAQLYE
ncbi:MAG: hypothetical protein LBE55_02495 [Clostridiales bacterium]|jgi:uncharacterized protein YlaN (UPF0358 family)|nr:hypothetical protein [Clostridiales bacterium]